MHSYDCPWTPPSLTALLFGMVWLLAGPETASVHAQADPVKPNFVIVYCDDLGYGDLGCFGAQGIRTPNINRLAQEGMKFTDFYAASPVCTPSRAALLTGRIPQRMGIVGVYFPESFTGMPTDEITIAELLRGEGYRTGIVGKWHLGHRERFLPLQRGFDEYFGIPYSNDMDSVVYLEGNDVVEFEVDQTYTTRTYTEKSVDFINRHRDRPFFLYLAHSMPHVPIYASPEFQGSSDQGLYGDVIQEIDWSVGEVLKALEDNGILDHTLVVFSSDNGPWLVMREHGGSAGPLREGKMFTFEGGVRVPTLAMWRNRIQPGSVYHDLAVMMDWFPTMAEAAGAELPEAVAYYGESLIPVLTGKAKRQGQEHLYYDGSMNLECYRRGDWKIKLPYAGSKPERWRSGVPAHPMLLFNLRDDPGEQHNLAAEEPAKVEEMLAAMYAFKATKGTFPAPIFIRSAADEYHYAYLTEKYGEDYWMEGWTENTTPENSSPAHP